MFHGRKGQLFQRYYEGMEDQLGALGIVLNILVLWNTLYIDDALTQLRAQGYPVLTTGRRPLRDPGAPDDEDE